MRTFLHTAAIVICCSALGLAQEALAQAAPAAPEQELARVSRELQETRAELSESRRQIEELRQGLEALRSQVQNQVPANEAAPAPAEAAPVQSATVQPGPVHPPEPTVSAADQDPSFLSAKVAELHQDKVESKSKYPVRISGLILFNAYGNHGVLDAQDLPSLAYPGGSSISSGGVGGTLAQTLLGVDVQGPRLLGAETSGSAEVDFGGGIPPIEYGAATGIIRLRTATVHLDWVKTSINIGQDVPFFSPLNPTSYATVESPALSWSGNLWVWTPQIEVQHRFTLSDDSQFVVQAGVLDPFTEEIPQFQGRIASAGEESRVPALAGRIAWDRSAATRYPFAVGLGGYRAKQRYLPFPQVDSWTLNADAKIALGRYFALSGEGYRGQAAGGLGGGIWTSVSYPDPTPQHSGIHALASAGGWVQLKATPTERFEINGAVGQDENFAHDFVKFPYAADGSTPLKKNRTELVNFIYKPNSLLLFALEYRRIFTAQATNVSASGAQLNIAAGVRF
jgi:hypothetical protein